MRNNLDDNNIEAIAFDLDYIFRSVRCLRLEFADCADVPRPDFEYLLGMAIRSATALNDLVTDVRASVPPF